MAEAGYAVVPLESLAWSADPGGVDRASPTGPLGATEVAVDAYRAQPGGRFDPPAALETLLVPLRAAGPLAIRGATTLPPTGVARVPAGVEASVRSEAGATVLVVGAPADPAPDDGVMVFDLDDAGFVVPETSDVATAFLTGPLGCAAMKVNARRLDPGQAVPYHTEGDQEEVFVPVRGPASMRIAGEAHETPVGTVVRVAPDVPRSAVNDGDAPARWVMVGAPPTGGPTGWDPGAEVVE